VCVVCKYKMRCYVIILILSHNIYLKPSVVHCRRLQSTSFGPAAIDCTNTTCVGYQAGVSQLATTAQNTVVLGNSAVNKMYMGPSQFSPLYNNSFSTKPSGAIAFRLQYFGSDPPAPTDITETPVYTGSSANVLYASTMWVGGMFVQMTSYTPTTFPPSKLKPGYYMYSFPMAFPTACLGVMVTPYNSGKSSNTVSAYPSSDGIYTNAPASPTQLIFFVLENDTQVSILAWGY
jgi:hypothetical protein